MRTKAAFLLAGSFRVPCEVLHSSKLKSLQQSVVTVALSFDYRWLPVPADQWRLVCTDEPKHRFCLRNRKIEPNKRLWNWNRLLCRLQKAQRFCLRNRKICTVWSQPAPLADGGSHLWSVPCEPEETEWSQPAPLADSGSHLRSVACEPEETDEADLRQVFPTKKKAPKKTIAAAVVSADKVTKNVPTPQQRHVEDCLDGQGGLVDSWMDLADEESDTEEVRQRKEMALASLAQRQSRISKPLPLPQQEKRPDAALMDPTSHKLQVDVTQTKPALKERPLVEPNPASRKTAPLVKPKAALVQKKQQTTVQKPVQAEAATKPKPQGEPAQAVFKGWVKRIGLNEAGQPESRARRNINWCFIEPDKGAGGKHHAALEALVGGKRLDIYCPRAEWPIDNFAFWKRSPVTCSVVVNQKGQLQACNVQLLDDGRYSREVRHGQGDKVWE